MELAAAPPGLVIMESLTPGSRPGLISNGPSGLSPHHRSFPARLAPNYSHSIVPGGLLVMSNALTSLFTRSP
jgi:hypothetical protein